MKRKIYHLSRSWYGEACLKKYNYVDEVTFGLYDPDGGTTGEMAVKWYDLGADKPPSPKFECFDDAWHLLDEFQDVINMFISVANKQIQPKNLCKLLKECGFEDATEEVQNE